MFTHPCIFFFEAVVVNETRYESGKQSLVNCHSNSPDRGTCLKDSKHFVKTFIVRGKEVETIEFSQNLNTMYE